MHNLIKKLLVILVIAILTLSFTACKVKEPEQNNIPTPGELSEQEQRLVQELDQALVPLGGNDPLAFSDGELSFLNDFSGARFVALGEATHGTKEFFLMKMRVFQYMVKHHGHRAFGIEADFAESMAVDRYITRGEGDLDDLMMNVMHFWVWRTEEVKQFIQWMRDYNTGKPRSQQLRYFGFDCQYLDDRAQLLKEYIEPPAPGLWAGMSDLLEQAVGMNNEAHENISDSDFDAMAAEFDIQAARLDTFRDQLVEASSQEDFLLHRHLLLTAKQAFLKTNYRNSGRGNTFVLRDQNMADNARVVADIVAPGSPVTLWAHNGHVANFPDFEAGPNMGSHLREALGEDYKILGFSFSTGTLLAWDSSLNFPGVFEIEEDPIDDSINLIFHHASEPVFAFHLSAVSAGSEWSRWLEEERFMIAIGAIYYTTAHQNYVKGVLAAQYDWLVHFDHAETSVPLQ